MFYINSECLSKGLIEPKYLNNFKVNNLADLACGANFWLILEREENKKIENWNEEEVMAWFKSIGLDMYVNITKYMKITGRDILEGDETFLINVLGMLSDHIKKVKYEISSIKNAKCEKVKLWGWGSNKQGQLAQLNFSGYLKAPVSIALPEMKNEFDYIVNVYCGDNYTFLMTRYGELYLSGNYCAKDQESILSKQNLSLNNNNNSNHNYNNHHANKKNKDGRKRKISFQDKNNEPVKTHLWTNVTKEICFETFSEEGQWK